ncbi:hypothetical protein A1O3_04609 [Capronia epimyces CBS 606.96]|uniref:Phytanoyl-CoA dioxygenase n=1 Tax=Capronia epimyces CBS 606.96 TaxID=1182542 RepID=W9XTS6_9EURO|nr:uncharacterized protein A1O3_04609 [Capronia epimyces CBS 606.96]EXJ83942.1 hypothetical protein A1O3_04609 [Capronia epimyces CBS 606.96]
MAPTATYPEGSQAPKVKSVHTPPPPKVHSFDASTASCDQIVQALSLCGGCIVRGMVPTEKLEQIERDTRPYIQADKPWTLDDFFPPETRRVTGLFEKSRAFIESIPANKLYQDVCHAMLTDVLQGYCGQKLENFVSRPQLNTNVIFSIGPGAKAQELHRDDSMHHNRTPEITPDEYKIGRDTGLGCFVAGKKTTRANGATRFIPGSHLWSHLTPPNEDLACYAELEPGDAFWMLSSAYHGGSANTTTNEERLVYACFMTKGYLRQEENQYLTTPLDVMRTYPLEVMKMAGYQASLPYLGWVNLEDPIHVLVDESVTGKLALQ